MRPFLISFLTFVVLNACTQNQQTFPEFSYHIIDTIGSRMGQTALVDIDRDGDLDWVTAEAPWGDSLAWWFEYRGPDNWIRHDIGKACSDVGGDCFDINADGWIDFWGGEILFLNNGDGRITDRKRNRSLFADDTCSSLKFFIQ